LRVWGACRGAPGLPAMMHHPGSRASNLYHITAPLRRTIKLSDPAGETRTTRL
jgi:hypothetical protein